MDLIEDRNNRLVENLTKLGYAVMQVDDIKPIEKIRIGIADWIRKNYNTTGSDEYVLNNIHLISNFRSDSDANKLTLECIKYISKSFSFDREIYMSSKAYFTHLFGQDIHSQKGNNIVLQHPHSNRVAELHIDAPPTSKFEVVSWVPLVDCYASKSFYVVPLKESRKLLAEYNSNNFKTWEEFKNACQKKSITIQAKYGDILFFSSTLLHGSEINNTDETRWCLNTRYKSLFAPTGMHDPLSFYNVLSTSPLTNIGFDLQG